MKTLWTLAFAILFLSVIPALVSMSCASRQETVRITAEQHYDRDDWGRWTDEDRDCQDTRQEVLIRQSEIEVTLDERGCKVVTGQWTCPFTGIRTTNPRELDIDHVVPLKEAFDSGASAWSSDKKRGYFNHLGHPSHLLAVHLSANRSKGSRDPAKWLPPLVDKRCPYLRVWRVLKQLWELNEDPIEKALIDYMVTGCDHGEDPHQP